MYGFRFQQVKENIFVPNLSERSVVRNGLLPRLEKSSSVGIKMNTEKNNNKSTVASRKFSCCYSFFLYTRLAYSTLSICTTDRYYD